MTLHGAFEYPAIRKLIISGLAAFVLPLLSSGAGLLHAENSVDRAQRPFTVRDSVEMSYFGNIRASMPNDLDEDGITSPDGRFLIKVTHRGVLPQGVTEGTIWLFDAAATKKFVNDPSSPAVAPVPLIRMSAAVNGGLGTSVLEAGNTVIAPRWAEDSRSLTFLGRDGRMNRQLFEIDIASRQITALTPPTQDVFSYSRAGKKLIYLTGPDADLQQTQAWISAGPDIPDVTIGTGVPLVPLLYPHFKGLAYGEPLLLELWEVNKGRLSSVRTGFDTTLVSLSPDGKKAIVIANDSKDSPLKYRLLDVDSGVDKPLLDFPLVKFQFWNTGRYRAEWSPDGRSVAVTEQMMNAPGAPAAQARRCDLAVFEFSKQALKCIVEHDSDARNVIYSMKWWPSGDKLDVRYKPDDQPEFVNRTLQRRGSKWIETKAAAERRDVPLQLTVRESLNEPPVLIATDIRSGKSRQIFDPNPQLADIDLGNVSVYEWKDPKGRALKGGLVKPPKFDPAKRYALVIQTHGFSESRFFRSGYSDTANAGRALAGRNIIVLQVREPRPDSKESWQDAQELGTNVYLAAIDQLAAAGLVDPEKVGISGYSYTGWTVANSITRAADRFAAAEIANTDPVTLTGYFEKVDTPAPSAIAESFVGARPYGEGLKLWMERVPSLATDKISAPVLFQAADPWHLIGVWDMYAALRDQRKPVELQYMRSGEHNIRKPAHVFAHQELLVDWFDFWLNDHEDAVPEKAEQYGRWQKMRR